VVNVFTDEVDMDIQCVNNVSELWIHAYHCHVDRSQTAHSTVSVTSQALRWTIWPYVVTLGIRLNVCSVKIREITSMM